jgi:hypothetical protein
MIGTREVAPNIVRIRIRIVIAIISIDIIEDEQPISIVPLSKPAHDLLDDYIDIALPIYRVFSTQIGNLTFWDPARATRNALL